MSPSGSMTPSLEGLGVTDAPLPRAGLSCALEFFALRMPSLSAKDQFDFLKGMDLHSPVREVRLEPSQQLAAFRKAAEDPLKLFYTKVGTSLHALGINPMTRGFRRFRVVSASVALESRCAAARDTWTDADYPYVASGGGTQYIIPDARCALVIVT